MNKLTKELVKKKRGSRKSSSIRRRQFYARIC